MTVVWHNLYLRSHEPERIATQFKEGLVAQGYVLYDPFGLIPGAAYADSLKMFVAPEQEGWVRMLVSPENSLSPAVIEASTEGLFCLSVAFNEDKAKVAVCQDGKEAEFSTLQSYLKAGCTLDDLHEALNRAADNTEDALSGDTFPMGVLPDDLKSAAQDLNPKHIDRMFVKLMKKVNRQLSGSASDADEARSLLSNNGINWQTAGAQQVMAFVNCLTLPDNWRTPEYVTLRDAYQRHRHRQRNPHGHLFPGDTEAMDAVPDALDFLPVYGGK